MTALLDAARDLFETLDAEAAIAEEAGTPMTHRAVALCRDAGLYGTMITRDAGGAELTIGESLDVFKELARADGSTGWVVMACLLYTSPSPRDQRGSRMPSSA